MATTTQLLYPAETTSGVVTSFIPLTTVFTHSSACSRYLRLNGDTLVAFDPGYGLDIDSNARCVPSAVTTWWEQGRFGNTNDEDHTAVSLGPMVCPHAWSTVVSSVRDHSSTLAMCCPPGYTLGNGVRGSVIGDCLSDIKSGAVITFQSTIYGHSVWSEATTTLSLSSMIGAIAIVGWNIDRPAPLTATTSAAFTTSTRPSSSSDPAPSTPPPIINTAALTSDSPPATSSAHVDPLSTKSAVGLGIGIGVGMLAIVALIVAAVITGRKIKRMTAAQQQQHEQEQKDYPPLQPNPSPGRVYELGHDEIQKAELEGKSGLSIITQQPQQQEQHNRDRDSSSQPVAELYG